LFLPVVKQMEQMSISFKGVLCSSVIILGGLAVEKTCLPWIAIRLDRAGR